MVQICTLENIEHKSMKQVSYCGKYSLSASRAHQSHVQFSFVVGDAFSTIINDNLNSVLLAGPAMLPALPLAKFNFDILVLRKDPYCSLLLSVMPVDAAQKKMMKFD